jgi:PEP-CTERM motif
MSPRTTIAIVSFGLCLASPCAVWGGEWVHLEFQQVITLGVPVQPLVMGIDSGSGFVYSTLTDDDGDGVIHLPPVPDGAGLALGVDVDGEVGCDLWDLVGTQVKGTPGATIMRPLLIIAEDVEGEALGMDSSPFLFPLPPTRTLLPGERLAATNGQLADWPDLRLVTAGPSLTTLDEYVRQVDGLANFSGDVIVSNYVLTGTFVVPEPSTWTLAIFALIATAAIRYRRYFTPRFAESSNSSPTPTHAPR